MKSKQPSLKWNDAENAHIAYVRFPDGHREKIKRKHLDDATADLNDALARRASADAAVKAKPLPKIETFDEVVEAWIEAGCPNPGISSGGGQRRRHASAKSESTISQAQDLLRPNVTRPDVIHPKAKRKYPTTHRVKASLGSLWVDRTTTQRVEEVFAAMDADGLSTSTIYRTWWHLNNALAWRVRQRRIKTNPAADCLLPEVKPGREVKSLTLDGARALFAKLPEDRLAPLWLTALMVGMRPGEILGVRWPFLDLEVEQPFLAIDERAGEVRHKYVGQAPPKVGSNRTVALHPFNVAALVAHRAQLIELGLYDPEGFVFPTRNRGPHSQANVRKYFKRLCRNAKLGEGWTTNGLRHSFASIADEFLEDRKLVGKVMGHNKLSTTGGYVHTVHTTRPVIEHAVEVWNAFLDTKAS